MNKNTLFTIAIPAFKSKFLGEAVESCLSQTYGNFEVVIVDDASPEDLKSVMDRYHDDRIKFYRNEKNCGAEQVVDNWNKCLSYASGEYIICMGDDDKLKPNCLEVYERLTNEYPNVDVFHAWTEIINENGAIIAMQEPRPIFESSYSMLYNRFRYDRIQYIGDWLFRTQQLKNKGGFYNLPFAWGSDDMTVFLTAKMNGIVNSQLPLFQYRVNTLTITNSGNDEKKIVALCKMEKVLSEELSISQGKTELDLIYIQLLKKIFMDYIQERISGHLINYFKNNCSILNILQVDKLCNCYLSRTKIVIAYIRGINRKIKRRK